MSDPSDPTVTSEERARVAGALDALFVDGPAADATPLFYAVTGSRIYGFADGDSDIDVRGVHVVDADEYLRLDPPAERYALDPADAPGGGVGVDLVSYELRKFGSLLADGNFNAVETVLAGGPVANESPGTIDSLRTLLGDALPLDVPRRYYGMATSNYRAFPDPDAGADPPSAKASLYAIRGLLAAVYTAREAAIEADVTVLTDWWGDDDLSALVAALVEEKRRGSGVPNAELAARADAAVARLVDAVEPELPDDDANGARYRERLDEWMLAARAEARGGAGT